MVQRPKNTPNSSNMDKIIKWAAWISWDLQSPSRYRIFYYIFGICMTNGEKMLCKWTSVDFTRIDQFLECLKCTAHNANRCTIQSSNSQIIDELFWFTGGFLHSLFLIIWNREEDPWLVERFTLVKTCSGCLVQHAEHGIAVCKHY